MFGSFCVYMYVYFVFSGFKDQVPTEPQSEQETAHTQVYNKPTTHHILDSVDVFIYVWTLK